MFFTRADGIPGAEGFLLKVEEKSSFMCSKQNKKKNKKKNERRENAFNRQVGHKGINS